MVDAKQARGLMIDPRTRLVLALAAAAVVVSSRNLAGLGIVALPMALLIACSATAHAFTRWIKLVLPMALFFGVVTAWAFGTLEGVIAGVKLLWLTIVGFIFFVNTPPEDLANALVQSRVPFRAAFVVSAGMQFIPVLGRKAQGVLEAQKARGMPLTGGWRAMRHYPAFLLPLLVQSFQLAEELAEAMECRGFGRQGRTFYKQYKLRPLDYGLMIGSTASAGLLIWGLRQWS